MTTVPLRIVVFRAEAACRSRSVLGSRSRRAPTLGPFRRIVIAVASRRRSGGYQGPRLIARCRFLVSCPKTPRPRRRISDDTYAIGAPGQFLRLTFDGPSTASSSRQTPAQDPPQATSGRSRRRMGTLPHSQRPRRSAPAHHRGMHALMPRYSSPRSFIRASSHRRSRCTQAVGDVRPRVVSQ